MGHVTYSIYQSGQIPKFPENCKKEVVEVINEGWFWLFRNGLIVPEPGTNGNNGFMIPTRVGKELLANPEGFGNFIAETKFPKALLHQSIADKVWATLVQGNLDVAVFIAFKAVEVAVRDVGKYAATDIGIQLMRKAFDKKLDD